LTLIFDPNQTGSYIAADARLLHADNLTVDESTLTGESLPVKKNADLVCQAFTPLAERHNLVYRGTVVTGGKGFLETHKASVLPPAPAKADLASQAATTAPAPSAMPFKISSFKVLLPPFQAARR
jgi:Ca2+-transporting ATPase